MRAVGILPVVVHGGGPQIGELMARLGKETEFRDGLRVTDADTLDIARMVLVGKVNRDIVSAINVHGPLAVGMSGEDANLITAAPEPRRPRLRRQRGGGRPHHARSDWWPRGSSRWWPPSAPTSRGQAYNINADTVAGALAEALAGREADLPDRHRRAAGRGRRPDDGHPPGLPRGDRRDRAQRGSPGRHDAQGRGVRHGGARRRGPGAHPRRACARTRCCSSSSPTRASAPWCCRDRPGTGGRRRPIAAPPHAHLRRAAGHLRAGPGDRSSSTPTARSTSTSSPAWPWCRSATPTRPWPTPWPSRPGR